MARKHLLSALTVFVATVIPTGMAWNVSMPRQPQRPVAYARSYSGMNLIGGLTPLQTTFEVPTGALVDGSTEGDSLTFADVGRVIYDLGTAQEIYEAAVYVTAADPAATWSFYVANALPFDTHKTAIVEYSSLNTTGQFSARTETTTPYRYVGFYIESATGTDISEIEARTPPPPPATRTPGRMMAAASRYYGGGG